MKTYKPTIGIEVHAEINTKSKMFCGCKNDPYHSEPNTNICPVCLAHPGTLPVVNMEAVRKILMVGEAIGGETADYSEFDRKQYFYPDIPKAYQLSQYAFPFVKGGTLANVKITRVHLEEDTAKSLHDNASDNANGTSSVDFNRAGVPLMELVTEPVIHDAKTAGHFGRELQLLLRTLGISEANMDRGEMRVEANISISDTDELGVKVEVKNLNSFKAMEQAIEYEISRQSEILARNGSIAQETRGWDESKSKTFVQRSKESAMDYRYFPDPDIPKFALSKVRELDKTNIRQELPTLPYETRQYLASLGLGTDSVETLIYDREALEFFLACFGPKEASLNADLAKTFVNYLLSDVAGLRSADSNLVLNSAHAIKMSALMQMLLEGKVNSRVAKDLLKETVFEGKDPAAMAESRNLLQNNSLDFLQGIVEKVIEDNESVAQEVREGKDAAIQYLVGQGMKVTKGSIDPKTLSEMLRKKIISG